MKMLSKFSAAGGVLLALGLATGAVQAKDTKTMSSAICQAMSPDGAANLMHRGSSLQAKNKDVTVICPIIMDKHGPLVTVTVRHLRPDGASQQRVEGQVFACTMGDSDCKETRITRSHNTNKFTSVSVDTRGLPSDSDHYYYYRSVLPKNWKITGIRLRQD